MVDYKLGKIYKIISKKTNKIYIGSTCCKYLSRRLALHRIDYEMWREYISNPSKYKKRHATSSFEIIKCGYYKIILIENYPSNSKDELRAREQYWIDKNEDICVNKYKAKRNSEKCFKEYRKKYYNNNKDKICNHTKKYYYNNREKILQNRSKKELCIYCDQNVAYGHKLRHSRTKNHTENKKFFDSL